MRLLNTATGEFVWVDHPEQERYAILSHVWSRDPDAPEYTYHDILRIQEAVRLARASDPTIPADEVLRRASPKIRNACRYALSDGLSLIWIDAPCIDKTSSAELSEAINSMYEWYRLSTVCYAFLHDVSQDPYTRPSSFRRSTWHTRGWTLQELIAPAIVVFLSSDWRCLGGKHRLAVILEDVTGIDEDVLTHSRPLSTICVARRMFWASKRRTTRKEDQAYCLMGIFGVHIPIIYGEGSKAFLRLQEEILKHIPDQSIFIWYRTAPTKPPQERTDILPDEEDSFLIQTEPLSVSPISIGFRSSATSSPILCGAPTAEATYNDASHDHDTLFASSPARFAFSSDVRTIPRNVLAKRLGIHELPPTTYIVTSEGMRVVFPIRSIAPSIDVAVLACEDQRGNLLGLVLRQTKLAYVRSVGAPLDNLSFLDNSSKIITQHPSVYIHSLTSNDTPTRPLKSSSLLRSIFPIRSIRAREAQHTTAEVYVVHYRSVYTPLHPSFAVEHLQEDFRPFKIIVPRCQSSASYTCAFSESSPLIGALSFPQSPSVVSPSNLQLVPDMPSYTLRITGEAEWTFVADFTSSQCTSCDADSVEWSSLAVKVTCTREGAEVMPWDYPDQPQGDCPRPGETCVDHVHCWSGSNLFRHKSFGYPSTNVWGPLFIQLGLYLEHPGSHAYPPTFSLSADVTTPRKLSCSSLAVSSESIYCTVGAMPLGPPGIIILSNDCDDTGRWEPIIRYSLLWRRRLGVAMRYGREGFRRIYWTEDRPIRPQPLRPAHDFGYSNLRKALDQNPPNPAQADRPAFEGEEQQEASTPLAIRISIMGRVPYIGQVNQMIDGQHLSKGMLATAVAREVNQFLERERAYGDPLRYREREIQLEDLALVDVERDSSGVLVPMLALSVENDLPEQGL